MPGPGRPAAVVLASASPRRRVLLAMLGVEAEVVPPEIDEGAVAADLHPQEAVRLLAIEKARVVDGRHRPVLAADTVVVLDEVALGKPADRGHARQMLEAMSGRQVAVITAVAVKTPDGHVDHRLAFATLAVDELDDATIADYLDSGEADDKAGAISAQGAAGEFVTVVHGSRSNVVGLPLAETVELLRGAGVAARRL